jgi:hypothetical protein
MQGAGKMKNTVSGWVSCLAATVIVAAVMAPPALADADKDAKKESRRLQAQLSAVQKEKGMLTTQVEELKKQLGDIGSKSEVLEKKSGSQRKQLADMTEKYQEADKKLQETQLLYADASKSLQQLQTEKEQEQRRLSGDIRVCEKKNADLYRISADLMDKYQAKGMLSMLLLAEPFTQLERVKVQNLLQEYGDKAAAAKVVPASVPLGNAPVAATESAQVTSAVAKTSSEKAVPSNAPATGNAGSVSEPGNVAASEAQPSNVEEISTVSALTTEASGKVQDAPRP